jgi:hypothetical protein
MFHLTSRLHFNNGHFQNTKFKPNMFPPVEPDIAASNPKFDALYRDLCTNKLNPDGTTKVDAKAQKERDALAEVSGLYYAL